VQVELAAAVEPTQRIWITLSELTSRARFSAGWVTLAELRAEYSAPDGDAHPSRGCP
jgi:hypothetical protein